MPPELIRNTSNSHFVPASNDLRQLLQERSENILVVASIGNYTFPLCLLRCTIVINAFSFQDLRLPEELQGYHTLVPIEPSGANVERRKLGNWLSVVYRAIRTLDGIPYALRRIESACLRTIFFSLILSSMFEDFRLTQQSAFAPIEVWSQIHHPNIIAVREAFTTRSFGDNCIQIGRAHV